MRSMAFRVAAVAAKPSSPPPPKSTTVTPISKSHQREPLSSLPLLPPASTTAVSLLALFSTPVVGDAKAFSIPKEDLLSSLTKVEGAVDQVEKVGSSVLKYSMSVINVLFDALKPTVEAAAPVAQQAGEGALKIALPLVSKASKQAQEALQGAGVDPTPVTSAAKTVVDAAQQSTKVIEGAKPIASATFESIVSNDPAVIAGSAGALFLAYLLFPSVWSVISFGLRGYKGKLSPALTLDLVTTQNHLVIDIRAEKDKNKAGIPRLPSNAMSKLISLPLEELPSKIQALVRNPKKVEAEIVALKISYLKRVNRGSNIVIMDSYCDTAKTVAKWLTAVGFKNVWVMTGGFSGGRGWSQCRLGTDSYNVTLADVLLPSRVIPAAVARFGTTSSSSRQPTQRLLPRSVE